MGVEPIGAPSLVALRLLYYRHDFSFDFPSSLVLLSTLIFYEGPGYTLMVLSLELISLTRSLLNMD